MDHYFEHQRKIQEDFEYVIYLQRLVKQNLESLISRSSTDTTLDRRKQIHELKMKLNESEKTANMIQQQLQDLKGQLITVTNELEPNQNGHLESQIECLGKDTEELKSKVEEIDNDYPTRPLQDEEMIEANGSNATSRITHRIHLSHNYIRWIRGPAKTIVHGMTHVVDMYTETKHISDAVVQAVKQGLAKQEQQTTNNSHESVFTEITSDWTFEGENADRGFISASVWMRDPQNRRILVKTQGHPLCAVNEWLAYILGKSLDLPVNVVQIAIYQNKLVTLHTDIAHENEKTMTFMDLPKQTRKTLLTYPIMESMDLFDHIIQNVDRTPRNILITMPNTTTIADETATLKIHLIDHSFCFGVGKRDVISAIACKLHSKHFAVVKFDPIDEERKFEQYLNKLPKADRTMIGKTLNHFAAINDDQFDSWMTEVHDLLSSSQCNRIHDVLRRQRDIARYYTVQWDTCPTSIDIRDE